MARCGGITADVVRARHAVVALASLLAASTAAATTYYVGPQGCDDGGAGANQSTPWCTIGKANATLSAGDTVLIAAGTYADQIRPANDGTADTNRITYRALGDGNVDLTAVGNAKGGNALDQGAIALGGKSYVTVDGVRRLIRVRPGSAPFSALGNVIGATGCIVDNVDFDGSTETEGQNEVFFFNSLYGSGSPESQFNVLRNSKIRGTGNRQTPRTEDLIHVAGNAHHNLIENDDIEQTWHVAVNCGGAGGNQPHDNVLRGNTIRNPIHTALQFYQGGAFHNLVEGNVLSGSGGNPCSDAGPGNVIEATAVDHVIRYNVVEKGGCLTNRTSSIGGIQIAAVSGGNRTVTGNRFYNDTIVKDNGFAIAFMMFAGGTFVGNNKIVNSILYGVSNSPVGTTLNQYWDARIATNDRYIRNVFGSPKGTQGQAVIASDKPGVGSLTLASAVARLRNPVNPEYTAWHGFENVYDASPGFRGYDTGDYALAANSRYIDAGAHLSQVARGDAGSGTSLKVEDARFFWGAEGYPPWMGIRGDTIAIGTISHTVEIASVDLRTNVVTLASSIVRSAGDRIWVIRDTAGTVRVRGSAPDIGALEHDRGAQPPTRPQH